MASVHPIWKKRKNGERFKRFQLSYYDAAGKRVRKNYATAGAANAERVRVEGQMAAGTHIADAKSLLVGPALAQWLDYFAGLVKAGLRAQSTWDQYDDHVNHIKRYAVAKKRLSRMATPAVKDCLDALTIDVSVEMAGKVKTTFSTAVDWFQQKGWIVGNPVAAAKVIEVTRVDDADQVGWPTKAEVKAIVDTARSWTQPDHPQFDHGRALAMVMLGFFNGPRPSELFAFERPSVSLLSNAPKAKVVQRLDRRGVLGAPKSKAGRRELPLGVSTTAALRAWVTHGLQGVPPAQVHTDKGPRQALMLFPYLAGDDRARQALKPGEQRRPCTDIGKPMQYHIFDDHIWTPLLIEAGVTRSTFDAKGNEIPHPRFGPHYMRHVFASIQLEMKVPPKRVQVMMGHADFKLFMDTYGHLFEQDDVDAKTADATETAILG
jgi:integrase